MSKRVDTELVAELLGVSGWDHQDLSWMKQGVCSSVDPELFFPTMSYTGGKDNGGKVAAAKKICNGDPERGVPACPVLGLCRDYAVLHPEEMDGVWGGTSKLERMELRRQRREDRQTIRGAMDISFTKRQALSMVDAHMTYREIAAELGISPSTISVWVHENDEPEVTEAV